MYDQGTVTDYLKQWNGVMIDARGRLIQIAQQKMILEGKRMYPSVAKEQWQDRNGKGKYLYMIFRLDRRGGYQGPDGKRKLYVGNKAARIDESRAMNENRRQFEDLEREERLIRRWLDSEAWGIKQHWQEAITWRKRTLGPAIPVPSLDDPWGEHR